MKLSIIEYLKQILHFCVQISWSSDCHVWFCLLFLYLINCEIVCTETEQPQPTIALRLYLIFQNSLALMLKLKI